MTLMETLYLPQALFAKDFKHVYEPAEDTFILLDALENDLNTLKNSSHICLECGSGSGVVITSIAKSFQSALSNNQQQNGSIHSDALTANRLLFATDINFSACKTTQKCATYFGQEHNIQVIQTDLAECLVERLENSVDLLVFNPPYVPTEQAEMLHAKQQTGITNPKTSNKGSKKHRIDLAWAGGRHGRQVIDIFLKQYVKRLLSKPNGVAYMVALEANNIDDLTKCLRSKDTGEDKDDENDIIGSVVLKRRAGSENLYVLKYQHYNGRGKNK